MFSFNLIDGQYVPFKITDLKLKNLPRTQLRISGLVYKPIAADFHKGSEIHSGHYMAYLKQNNTQWVCANDMSVNVARWPNNAKDLYVIVLKRN